MNTSSNVLMFGCSTIFRWDIGAVLRLHPVTGGHHAPEGHAVASVILRALLLAALAWLVPMRGPTRQD